MRSLDRLQCWIADRDYSTKPFLFGIKRRKAYFVIRQHRALKGQLIGRRQRVGRTETGVVYEQRLRLTDADGNQITVRRISVKLDKPTRDGDTEIHLLSNLPKKVGARKIVESYRTRWDIETAFAKLTTVLRCELNTLGYPDAALFGFCIAVVMYNAVSTVIAALRVTHPEVEAAACQETTPSKRKKFSFYYLADEISGVWRGMMIAIPNEYWTETFASLTTKQIAKKLLWLGRKVKCERFLTNPFGPQQRSKQRKMTTRGGHVSTHRIIQQRKLVGAKT